MPLNVRPCAIKLRDTTDQFIWESPKTGLPCNPTHFRDVFRKSLEEAGDVRLLTPHSCRHTYVSQMQALGVDIQTIQSIVGHADTEMTEHYTQLFNLLCDKADDVYGGKLPIHVRCLIDECANIGQIPNLEKLVATIRSREISACLVLQARSQLKAIYKDNADTIVGNMDSQIFLGGSEPTTLKDLSEMLGKETIDAFNTSDTRGNSPSYGTSFQKLGHELLSRDEIAVLDGGKCILQLRGVRPFLSDKYDLTQHPNYKLTSDYDPKNTFDIEKYLNRKEKIHPGDEFIVVDADSLPSA